MLKDLIKVANKLDQLGLQKEADYIDFVIKKISSDDLMLGLTQEEIDQAAYRRSEGHFHTTNRLLKNFYSGLPSSVDDRVKYYAENMAELHKKGIEDDNHFLSRKVDDIMDDFYSVIQTDKMREEEGITSGYDPYKSLMRQEQFEGWKRKDFKRCYDMFENLKIYKEI